MPTEGVLPLSGIPEGGVWDLKPLQASHPPGESAPDAYTGDNRMTKPSRKGGAPIRVAHCWAYARQKLKEILDRHGAETANVRHCA